MSLSIFMGTHLPEMAECFASLAKTDPPTQPTRIFIPAGLDSAFPEPENCIIAEYQPGTTDWAEPGQFEGRAFILIDPRLSPVPQLSTLAHYLKSGDQEPDKVVTCVDCAAVELNPALRAYMDACIYYSDDVLLGNRASTSKSFLRNFQKEYERRCYPCLFLLLKGNGVPNDPVEILTPGIRRISQLFDLTDNQEDTVLSPLIEASCDLDLEELEENPYQPSDETLAPNLTIPDVSRWIVPIGG